MDDEPKVRIPDAVCSAMSIVWAYIHVGCTDRSCPYGQLLSEVQEQNEADRKVRQEAERKRLQEIEEAKIEKDIE